MENDHASEMRRCLIELDIPAMQALHAHLSPHLAQPNDEQTLVSMHMARTQMPGINVKLRFYSHQWLCERGYPSALPDRLKPMAERMYPKVVDAVGISVNFSAKHLKPAAARLEKIMSDAVADAYADGRNDPEFVKARMAEARAKEQKKLFG